MYSISVYGSSEKWGYSIKLVNHKETKSGYKLENCWDKQIKKEKLNTTFSFMMDTPNFIERKMYCLNKEEVVECINLCYQEVVDIMENKLRCLNAMQNYDRNIVWLDYTKLEFSDLTKPVEIIPFTKDML